MLSSNAHGQCSVAMLDSNGTYGRTDERTNEEPPTPQRILTLRNAGARTDSRLMGSSR